MTRLLGSLVLLACLGGCATAPPPPPAHLGRTIVVLPPANRTGDRLAVGGTGLIDRYVLHASLVTVADVLLSEARFRLQEQGFEVPARPALEAILKGRAPTSPAAAVALASEAGLRQPVLYLEIRHWEPDAPVHPAFVIVGLSLSLFDPSTGRVVWHAERRAAPVPTPGEVSREAASVTAARKVVAEMLAPLRPDEPARPWP